MRLIFRSHRLKGFSNNDSNHIFRSSLIFFISLRDALSSRGDVTRESERKKGVGQKHSSEVLDKINYTKFNLKIKAAPLAPLLRFFI